MDDNLREKLGSKRYEELVGLVERLKSAKKSPEEIIRIIGSSALFVLSIHSTR